MPRMELPFYITKTELINNPKLHIVLVNSLATFKHMTVHS